jgi:hypothetical protein
LLVLDFLPAVAEHQLISHHSIWQQKNIPFPTEAGDTEPADKGSKHPFFAFALYDVPSVPEEAVFLQRQDICLDSLVDQKIEEQLLELQIVSQEIHQVHLLHLPRPVVRKSNLQLKCSKDCFMCSIWLLTIATLSAWLD